MSHPLYDSLATLHRFDDLEGLLDHMARTVSSYAGWSTVLVTFYFGDDVFYGTVGCPEGTRERFRASYEQTSPERRASKRAEMMRYSREGTNICFVPTGEGPRPASAYIPSVVQGGSWQTDDRLLIMLRGWEDRILGMVSLDNPVSSNRPDESAFAVLEEVDRYANIVAKVAENRFWSLRLQESEAAYRGVFDAATDALIIAERDGRFVEVNPAACRLHGYTYDEMMDLPADRIVHPDSGDILSRFLAAVDSEGEARVEGMGLHKDGTAIDLEVRGVSFHYRGRQRVLVVLQDVTEKKRLLQELLDRQRDESIVAVAGGVAHDFNNLLLGVTGSLSLLQRELESNSEAQRQCARIGSSADELARLTGQLLAIARGVRSESKPVLLARIVEENLSLIRGMVGGRYRLSLESQGGLWAARADSAHLGQLVLNLAQNSCDAMSRGGTLTIRTKNAHRTEDWTCDLTGPHPRGDYTCLSVEDDGHGMDESVVERVFEPYFSTKENGSGLGLPAVLGIVRRHQGAIQLTSTAHRGTEVEVLLPRCEEYAEEPGARRLASPTPGKAPLVLLVDDVPQVLDVAGEMIRAVGYEVEVADSGERALELYRQRGPEFDLVLMDVQMPGMSGVEACEAIYEQDPKACVVLTSGHTEELVRAGAENGMRLSGFLQKPYNLKRLGRVLADAMRSRA